MIALSKNKAYASATNIEKNNAWTDASLDVRFATKNPFSYGALANSNVFKQRVWHAQTPNNCCQHGARTKAAALLLVHDQTYGRNCNTQGPTVGNQSGTSMTDLSYFFGITISENLVFCQTHEPSRAEVEKPLPVFRIRRELFSSLPGPLPEGLGVFSWDTFGPFKGGRANGAAAKRKTENITPGVVEVRSMQFGPPHAKSSERKEGFPAFGSLPR